MSNHGRRSEGIYERRRNNELKKCHYPTCRKQRRGLSRFCGYHEGKQTRYGHPEGYFIPPRQYLCEIDEAREFIARHLEHKGVQAGIEWFDVWLRESAQGLPVIAKGEFRRLSDYGVTGMECLVSVLAIWLYSHRRPSALPSDNRLTFALALSVLHLAPREKTVSWRDGEAKEYGKNIGHRRRKEVGKLIRTMLGVFVHNAMEEINREIDRENDLKLALGQTFR